LSQKRARLRALASLGLSIVILGALVPGTSAASREASATFVAPAANSPRDSAINAPLDSAITIPSATSPVRAASAADPAGASSLLAMVIGPIGVTSQRQPLFSASAAAPATVAASTRVIALAETHIGGRYQHGATGPRTFDCSGLVYRVFEDAGLGRKIDGLRSASALYVHFRALHMTSTRDPQLGDLVIFGGGSHVGIYIGAGRVVHAMVSGVAITRINAVYPRFTTYVHLGLTTLGLPVGATPTAAPRGRGPRVLETVRTIVPLSLRAAPSTAARRLLVLRPGARLAVIAITRGPHNLRWFQVIVPGGRIGWVAAGYTR